MPNVPDRTLTITDSFMFDRVMRDENICKGLLERLLGFPIDHIVYQNTEQVIDFLPDAKGIQLDLYLRDDARVYDVEVQVKKRSELPRRLRYYQSVIDSDLLSKGSSHAQLRESFIIFLCAHDPFDDGIPIYTLERTCQENGRVVDTGAHWLVFNCRAWQRVEGESLRNLLEYLENGNVADDDMLVEAIDEAVTKANADRKWVSKVRSVNTIYNDARTEGLYDGRMEGLEEGRIEGRVQGIAEGRIEGRVEGIAEGRAEGRAEGEERISKLMKKLFDADRVEDARRASEDSDYRESLFVELGLA